MRRLLVAALAALALTPGIAAADAARPATCSAAVVAEATEAARVGRATVVEAAPVGGCLVTGADAAALYDAAGSDTDEADPVIICAVLLLIFPPQGDIVIVVIGLVYDCPPYNT